MSQSDSVVPSARSARLFGSAANEWITAALVVGGALLACTSLVANYIGLGFPGGFGTRQLLALLLGCGGILAGVLFDLWTGKRSLTETLQFWFVAAQVGALTFAFHFYHLENRAFYEFVAIITAFGFIANHYMPASVRLPFFFSLSIIAIWFIFGTQSPIMAVVLVAASLVMIGVCHIPAPVWVRVAILLAITAVLAALRSGWVDGGAATAALPILASLMMFRLAVYLYDIENKKGPTGIWHRLSYFFMLPNVAFPFFPVVDFSTFGRTYYNDNAVRIYQRGTVWMLRGFMHLVLYRVVNYYLLPAPSDVSNAFDFLQFIVANFALYLRISGSFHLIVGMLLLFGFNLHETHTRFYFSSSFIDFWRRINIYWKDFMQKMVFNPSYVLMKQRGMEHLTAVLIAIMINFLVTWALHAYQWFWLTGTHLFTPQDILFWALLGVFLMIQTVLEARRDAERAKGVPAPQTLFGPQVSRVVRVVSTFLTICLLWSFWTCDSLAAWIDLWRASGLLPALNPNATAADWALSGVVVAGVCVLTAIASGVSFGLLADLKQTRTIHKRRKDIAWREVLLPTGAVAACLIVMLGAPTGSQWIGGRAPQMAQELAMGGLSAREQATVARGYYEQLTTSNRFNSQLWEAFSVRPSDFAVTATLPPRQPTPDTPYLSEEYAPLTHSTFRGITYDTNRWGMRDDDYPLEKPPNTTRIVLLGASRTMGWGVNHEDSYEARLERALNDLPGDRRYEVLNLAMAGNLSVQRLIALDRTGWRFDPDIVLFEAGMRDTDVQLDAEMVVKDVDAPYPFIDDIRQKAGVDPSQSIEEVKRRLTPYRFDLAKGAYKTIQAQSEARGVPFVWIYLSDLNAMGGSEGPDTIRVKEIAGESGLNVVDLTDVYAGQDFSALRLNQWDSHPNPTGHALIADALFNHLLELDREQVIDLSGSRNEDAP